jgi:anti-sigma factor RsiW
MLTCREIVEILTDYLEDALPVEDRRHFEAHVAICPPCRGYLAQLRAIKRMAGRLTEEDVSPDAELALRGAFRDWKRDRPTGAS